MKKINKKIVLKQRDKILFWLTVVLIFMIAIIVKECSIPLYLPERYFSWLVSDTDADRTFYNIAISYVAAYIFYLIQVYISDCNKNKKAKKSLQPDIDRLYQNLVYIKVFFDKIAIIKGDYIEFPYGEKFCCQEKYITGDKIIPIQDRNYNAVKKMIDFRNEIEINLDTIKSRILYKDLEDEIIELLSDIELSGFYTNLQWIKDFSGAHGKCFRYQNLEDNCNEFFKLIDQMQKYISKPMSIEISVKSTGAHDLPN